MRRDVLLLAEMIDAAGQAQHLVDGVTVEDLEADRQRRDGSDPGAPAVATG
jgi:hypothetical protein